ncbi:hypothetical protein ACHQM5_016462 [Ranunculus cassubicifolius]
MESPPSKRLQSFGSFSSSSSSCSSSFRSAIQDISQLSSSPSFHISRVPFSWEQHPGIPKKHSHHHHSSKSIDTVLPLPPSAGTPVSRKFNLESLLSFGRKSGSPHGNLDRDPFAVALVECSKDTENDHQQEEGFEKYWKVSRVVSDRFGFIDRYTSCKKSCAVAESVILLPRSIRKASS